MKFKISNLNKFLIRLCLVPFTLAKWVKSKCLNFKGLDIKSLRHSLNLPALLHKWLQAGIRNFLRSFRSFLAKENKFKIVSLASVIFHSPSVILNVVKNPAKRKEYARGLARSSVEFILSVAEGLRMTIQKRPQRAITLIALIFLIIGAPTYFFLLKPRSVEAAWFNTDWGYRIKSMVTNSSGANLTNYQVNISIGTSALIAAGKMQSNCADIRITDQTGKILPYWIEESGPNSCNQTANTNVWVKVPTISSSGGTVYLYYGNPSASAYSDGSKTFDFFDGFNGTTVDNTKWNNIFAPAISGGSAAISSANTLVSKTTPTTTAGLGRLLFRAKEGATNLFGGKVGFSNSQIGTDFNADKAAAMNIALNWKTATNFTTSQTDADGNTLVGSNNIKDVFYYDTTKDSDGGAWTNNATAQASSWYSEAFSTTKGNLHSFPTKAWIVAEAGYVDIIDASTNKLWMRFVTGGSSISDINYIGLSGVAETVSSVYALNGEIFNGTTFSTTGNSGVHRINFKTDNGYYYNANAIRTLNGNISQRNSNPGAVAGSGQAIVHANVNDVAAAVISGKTYVAVATDGGVTVINETDGTVSNFVDTFSSGYYGFSGHVNITNNTLYASFGVTGSFSQYLYAWYNFPTNWASGASGQLFNDVSKRNAMYSGAYNYSTPSLAPNPPGSYYSWIGNFYVTAGTSTVDGTSNTIYLPMIYYNSWKGFTVLQEKQGDETNSSVKYYTKDYISEEMTGDIRGMWDFSRNTTLADGNTVPDSSSRTTDLTSVAGATVVDGVRGKGFSFNGSTQYLKQKVYMSQVGASFGPAYNGLSLANGQAFFNSYGVGLTGYKGNDTSSTPYMLVLKDSANKTAWGYIGAADATETLSTEKVINGNFTNWTADNPDNWEVSAEDTNNYVTQNSGQARIVSNGTGVQLDPLGFGQTLGKLYKITFDITDVTAGSLLIQATGHNYPVYSTIGTKTIYYTATLSNAAWFGLYFKSSGVTDITIDNVSIKEVTDVGTNGVHILSIRNGSTRNWAGIDAAFNYNDTAYTYEVRKTDFQITGDMTVGAWVKTTNTSPQQIILGKLYTYSGAGNNNTFRLEQRSSGYYFHGNGGGWYILSTSLPVIGQWTYVVGVASVTGGTVKIYVNGESQGTMSGSIASLFDYPESLRIGNEGDNLEPFFGSIDEPFVTAEALTAAQILNMWQTGCRAMGGTPDSTAHKCNNIPTVHPTNTLAGSVNNVSAVSVSDAKDTIYVGTSGPTGALSFLKTNSDTLTSSLSTASTPSLLSNDIVALGMGSSGPLNYGLAVGSGNSGVTNLLATQYNLTIGSSATNSNTPVVTSLPTVDTSYHNYLINVGSSVTVSQDGTSFGVGTSNIPNASMYVRVQNADPTNILNLDWIAAAKGSTTDTSLTYGAEEIGNGPVAYWKFDEGVGTSVYDSSSNKVNGTITGATWQTEDQCVSGKCLNFSGTNSYVDNTTVNYGDNYTVETWINPTDLSAVETYGRTIIASSPTSGSAYPIWILVNGNQIRAYAYSANVSSNYQTSIYNNIQTNNWYHVVVTATKSGSAQIYINGKYDSTFTAGSQPSNNKITVGDLRPARAIPFIGKIDDVKVFNYIRSAAQIQSDYNAGVAHASTQNGTNTALGVNNQNMSALTKGLVGYWKMDENVGTSTVDSSGNNNTGILGAGDSAPVWSGGMYGNGLSFDGVNDYVGIGNSTTYSYERTNPFSVCGWFKRSRTGTIETLVSKQSNSAPNRGWRVMLYDTNTLTFGLYNDNSNNFLRMDTVNTITSTTTWNHYCTTYDGSSTSTGIKIYINGASQQLTINSNTLTSTIITSSVVNIGARDNGYYPFQGIIDETRIYNRALSPAEVQQLYNWAPGPVGWWKMDEKTGTFAYDSSGNNNNAGFGTGNSAPTWTTGKYGGGLKFDGTKNYLSMPDNTILKGFSAMTVCAWVNLAAAPASGHWGTIIVKSNNTINTSPTDPYETWALALDVNRKIVFPISTGIAGSRGMLTSTNAVSLNTWTYLCGVYDGSTMKVYQNGVQDPTTLAKAITINNNNTDIRIGGFLQTGYPDIFNGSIDDIKIYNYARTTQQIIFDMNGAHPTGGSPIASQFAYWPFDEGYGTKAHNIGYGGSAYDGTLTCGGTSCVIPTWQSDGEIGKSLYFTGVGNTSRSMVNVASINVGITTGSKLTFSTWVKPESSQAASGGWLVRNGTGTDENYGINIGTNPTNNKYKITFTWYDGTAFRTLNSTNYLVPVGVWSHVLVVISQGEWFKIYTNGVFQEQLSWTNGNSVLSTSSFNLGGHNGTINQYLKGQMDEVKVYLSELSASDVLIDYNNGKSMVLGSASINSGSTASINAASQEYCITGDTSPCTSPVAEWRMEEGSGTIINDSTGNGNSGSFAAGDSAPTWTSGKYGKALKFDGSNDYVSVNDSASINNMTNATIELWMKLNSLSSAVIPISKDGDSGYYIQINANGQSYLRYGTAAGTVGSVGDITINNWIHLSMVFSSGTLTLYKNGVLLSGSRNGSAPSGQDDKLWIGAYSANGSTAPSSYWVNGSIDQVRIYNYARTPAQIAWEYNKGKPVGWWDFDECEGTIAHDMSGIGNTGLITIGAGGSQVSVGTCSSAASNTAWYNGASGKINSSINLDGVDDYVSLPSGVALPSAYTISAWVNVATFTGVDSQLPIYGEYNSGTGDCKNYLDITSSTKKVYFDQYTPSGGQAISNTVLSAGTWYHIVGVQTSTSSRTLYINGVPEATATEVYSGATPNQFAIGERLGTINYHFSGKIDDVRIYNYALTNDQVKSLYDGGAVRFGQ